MRPVPRRVASLRLDHLLILAGGILMTVGSVMPWIKGATRMNGTIAWTGLDDTGEGLMLFAAALALAAWVRWRGVLESELTPRARLIPLVVAIGCAFLWAIAFQKALYLSWFDLPVGARPQAGLLIAGVGVLLAIGGGLLAATDPASLAAARATAEAEKRRSGAGRDGAASDRLRRGGGEPPRPDEYSVGGRVDRVSGRRDGEPDDDRDRG
jgi:hypothetical protein